VTAAPVRVRDVPVEVRAPVDLRPLAQAEVGAKSIGYLDAEVHVKNPGELRSGMYGRAAIVTAVHRDALVVSASSVQVSNEKHVVYVLRGDLVKRVEIQVGVDAGTWLEVTGGLASGDEVVTAGVDALSDGAQVRAQRNVDPYTGVASSGPDGSAPKQQ